MAADWGYKGRTGPHSWHKYYPQAEGKRQSPVDIKKECVQYDVKLSWNPLRMAYDSQKTKTVINNGHTFKVDVEACDYNLIGGPLDDKYQLVQFHAHWGSRDEIGAEHTIDGKRYAAEIHLVHWNTGKFKTFSEAVKADRGIAVLGAFIKVGGHHEGFAKLIPFLKKIQNKNAETPITGGFDPSCLLPGNTQDYWTYEGSLTTPPCYESVSFILFKDVVEVSEQQLRVLRHLMADEDGDICSHGKLVDNFRPTCPLNGRVIKASFQE